MLRQPLLLLEPQLLLALKGLLDEFALAPLVHALVALFVLEILLLLLLNQLLKQILLRFLNQDCAQVLLMFLVPVPLFKRNSAVFLFTLFDHRSSLVVNNVFLVGICVLLLLVLFFMLNVSSLHKAPQ